MIIVIVAGGSGSRLWPLSTPNRPKHLLSVSNDGISLLQKTYNRARQLSDIIYVVTEKSHAHLVKDQLSDLDSSHIIVEPGRRGTASCLLASLAVISKNHSHKEEILTIPADHHIRDSECFIQSVRQAQSIFKTEQRIVMIGIKPDYPSTGFGYIQKGRTLPGQTYAYEVSQFKEKPTRDIAQEYIKNGNYLWSCSYFISSVDVYERVMKETAPEMIENLRKLQTANNTEEYNDVYLNLPVNSGEKSLIEKTNDTIVIQGNFDWKDLGTFEDLYRTADLDDNNNHILGNVEVEQVEGSFIQNYTDLPISIIGLNNIVVIHNENGIVIARKDMSQKIGDVSKRFTNKKD